MNQSAWDVVELGATDCCYRGVDWWREEERQDVKWETESWKNAGGRSSKGRDQYWYQLYPLLLVHIVRTYSSSLVRERERDRRWERSKPRHDFTLTTFFITIQVWTGIGKFTVKPPRAKLASSTSRRSERRRFILNCASSKGGKNDETKRRKPRFLSQTPLAVLYLLEWLALSVDERRVWKQMYITAL